MPTGTWELVWVKPNHEGKVQGPCNQGVSPILGYRWSAEVWRPERTVFSRSQKSFRKEKAPAPAGSHGKVFAQLKCSLT
jgi:hypothetical protein